MTAHAAGGAPTAARAHRLRATTAHAVCVCVQEDRALTYATEGPCRWTCLDPYTYSLDRGSKKKKINFCFFNFCSDCGQNFPKSESREILNCKIQKIFDARTSLSRSSFFLLYASLMSLKKSLSNREPPMGPAGASAFSTVRARLRHERLAQVYAVCVLHRASPGQRGRAGQGDMD